MVLVSSGQGRSMSAGPALLRVSLSRAWGLPNPTVLDAGKGGGGGSPFEIPALF